LDEFDILNNEDGIRIKASFLEVLEYRKLFSDTSGTEWMYRNGSLLSENIETIIRRSDVDLEL
jgi:hypothetical protein